MNSLCRCVVRAAWLLRFYNCQVTLGNIVGGAGCVAAMYSLAYGALGKSLQRKQQQQQQ